MTAYHQSTLLNSTSTGFGCSARDDASPAQLLLAFRLLSFSDVRLVELPALPMLALLCPEAERLIGRPPGLSVGRVSRTEFRAGGDVACASAGAEDGPAIAAGRENDERDTDGSIVFRLALLSVSFVISPTDPACLCALHPACLPMAPGQFLQQQHQQSA